MKFRARGLSMYPTIRNGDILTVIPKTMEEIQPEEIAVFRHKNLLVAHRIVEKRGGGANQFLRTRSEHSPIPDSFVCKPSDLVGIVGRIERKGRSIPLFFPGFTPAERTSLLIQTAYHGFFPHIHRFGENALTFIQRSSFFPKVVRFLGKSGILKTEFSLHLVVNPNDPFRHYQNIPENEFNRSKWWENTSAFRVGVLHLLIRGSKAATLTFSLPFTHESLRKGTIVIRRRFHGMGLEDLLVRKLDEIFRMCYPQNK